MMRNLIILSLLLCTKAFAVNSPVTIDDVMNSSFPAKDYQTSSLILTGSGFFPGKEYQDYRDPNQDVQHQVQVNYRQISPVLGDWQKAVWGRQGGVWISAISPNELDLSITSLTGAANANTAWSFQVCVQKSGCSNAITINVQGNSGGLSLDTGARSVDLAAGSIPQTIALRVNGVISVNPVLKVGRDTVWGEYVDGVARFTLPLTMTANPLFATAFIEDPFTGSDSENISIRIFGQPKVVSPSALSITQSLSFGQNIQDATVSLQFAAMTFPAVVQWQDGANRVNIPVPMDLLTNRASVKIPASALRVGVYTGNLLLVNAGGSQNIPVAVNISRVEYHPIPTPPRPGFPNPIPRP